MSEVTLVNATGHDIILGRGAGGIYQNFKTIPSGKEHVLRVDPNETYREYRCRLRDNEVSRKSEAVFLMPFVFGEHTHVTIKWDLSTDKLSYETTKKESGSNASANPWWFHRFINKFILKKEHAPSGSVGGDGAAVAGGSGGGDDANVPRSGGALDTHLCQVLTYE